MEFNTYKEHDTVKVSARCDMGERCSEQQYLCMKSCVTRMIINVCNASLAMDMQHSIDTSSIDTKITYMAHQAHLVIDVSCTIDVCLSDKVFDMFSTMLMSINEDLNIPENQTAAIAVQHIANKE